MLACAVSILGVAACAPKFEKLDDKRSARGTIGEEVYKALCRRVAGTEMPNDLDGRETEVLCLHDADEANQELTKRRARVSAAAGCVGRTPCPGGPCCRRRIAHRTR